ncbi:hypothetical protein R3P38DRAFT_3237800 [Favolaschia claudopus]|uniref:F-box domain-containing protein n=1 Tax=Favolaschia claudopus TaxID=2862362 RepID=A0AAV9ZA51_9AGAR
MDSAPLALLKESASSSIDRALLRFMDSLLLLTGAILSTPPILQCPSEVFCLLFRWVLCDLEPVTQEYRVQRARLSLVCRFWWKVVIGDAGLWQDVFVTPSSEAVVLSRVMQLAGSHTLSVYLVDDVPCLRYGASERQLSLLSHFHSILPTSARPALRCLTLRCPSRAALVTPVPSAVSVSCTNLRRLVLHRCNFPEAFPASLPNLTHLAFERLELVRVGIRIYPDDPEPVVSRVAIPSVTTLVLAFNVTLHPARAFFHILEHIEALNLSHLHLGLPTDSDVKHYLAAHPGLKSSVRFPRRTVLELRGGSVALREFLPCHAFGLGRSGQTICVATIRVSSWFAYTAGVAFAHLPSCPPITLGCLDRRPCRPDFVWTQLECNWCLCLTKAPVVWSLANTRLHITR